MNYRVDQSAKKLVKLSTIKTSHQKRQKVLVNSTETLQHRREITDKTYLSIALLKLVK